MGDLHLPVRQDLADSGEFRFNNHGVSHADDGHEMLRQYAPFDQGPAQVEDVTGSSLFNPGVFDAPTSRLYDEVKAVTLVAGAGVYKWRRRLLLPRDFGRSAPSPIDGTTDAFLGLFEADALSIFVYRDGDITDIKATLWIAGAADAGVNGVSIKPVAANTWTMKTLSPSGTYAPGQFVTLELEYDASTEGVAVRYADFINNYRVARGNV